MSDASRVSSEVTEKRCSSCSVVKPLDEFHRSQNGKYGRTSWCKDCASTYSKTHKRNRTTAAVAKAEVPPPPAISAHELFGFITGNGIREDRGDARLALAARIIDLQGEILRELIR